MIQSHIFLNKGKQPNNMPQQINKETKERMEKQGYRVVGTHSVVKPCGWTKKIMNDGGGCYKFKFYGINSAQCLQMSTSLSCANRCVFCWRDYKSPVSTEWKWDVDEPMQIINQSIEKHHNMLIGYKGSEKANQEIYQLSTKVKHVALSLTGEPITYPKINELIDEFHKKEISTFLVTNGQYPEELLFRGDYSLTFLKNPLKSICVCLLNFFFANRTTLEGLCSSAYS